ncbi:MAG: stage II sporulation protein M [Chloroflexota bacterium]|nr:stage II sporulation protein M [Chloroflexota bacterium]
MNISAKLDTGTTAIPSLNVPSMIIEERRTARETLSNALIITRREVRDSFRDWRIIGPIVVLTFLFPSLAQFVAGQFAGFVEDFGAQIVGERTIPFLLMIVGFFPISISLVIALETFVGEKERRSLEPLLSTPLTNTELYIGKTLAAMIPPLVSSYGGMAVYLLSLFGGELQWRPPAALIIQIILLTTVQALVMITGAVVVSSLTTSTRAANLLASFIIIPMTLIIQGESAIMFLAPDAESPNGIGALWAIIAGMVVVNLLLLRVGNSVFNREELLGRNLDSLKLKLMIRRFGNSIRSVDTKGTPALNIADWYARGVRGALARLGLAGRFTVGWFAFALIGGIIIGLLPAWQLNLPRNMPLGDVGSTIDQYTGLLLGSSPVLSIAWQNGRILLGAALLAMFTFGVGALVLTPLTYVVLGYLLTQVVAAGYSPFFLLAALFPHGLIEIPVIIIATAAAVRLGAVVTRVPENSTVGAAWTLAFTDMLKLALGIIIPGLLIAALLEAYVTPLVVRLALGG